MKNNSEPVSLEQKNFFIQNARWVSDSVQLLTTKDISHLHEDIAKRSMDSQRAWAKIHMQKKLTLLDRQERARLHQTLQVIVPAGRRCTVLLSKLESSNSNSDALSIAASRLAVFLLEMVAQSSLSTDTININCAGHSFYTVMPIGLTAVHRSVALDILRDNAELFGACPAWVKNVVVHPEHVSAANAMDTRHPRNDRFRRLALREKIINLRVLDAYEEQLLMRML